jgi:hypothetical protein
MEYTPELSRRFIAGETFEQLGLYAENFERWTLCCRLWDDARAVLMARAAPVERRAQAPTSTLTNIGAIGPSLLPWRYT